MTSPKENPEQPGNAAVSKHLGLVQQVVARFLRRLPPNVQKDDLVAAGTFGLMNSLERNGGDLGPQFEGYARIRIRGAILDELRTQDWLPRRARWAAAGRLGTENYQGPSAVVALDDLPANESSRGLLDDGRPSAVDLLEAAVDRDVIARALDRLPERERRIIELHYFQDVRFKDISQELGVSEPRVSQLHSRAISRLRALIEEERAAA